MSDLRHTPRFSAAQPYLFVAALFACFACNNLLTRGMFMDGLIYSSLAANLASGTGDLWHLQLSPSCFPQFYEHPPLMMWLLAAWMCIFGTSMLAAKAYSVAVLLLTAWLMVAIWHRLGFSSSTAFLPLLMLTLIPEMPLSIHNNFLESTLTLFVLLSIWFMLRWPDFLGHLLAGTALAAAALTKGPVGLFPLAMPLLGFLLGTAKPSFGKVLLHTAALLLGLLIPFAALWFFSPVARDYLTTYFHIQLVVGLHDPVASRTRIIGVLLSRPIIPLLLSATILILTTLRPHSPLRPSPAHLRCAALLFALVLCGSLPMMISTKQRAFYLLTIYPLFALAAAALLEPVAQRLNAFLHGRTSAFATTLTLALAFALNIAHCGKPGRNEALLADMDIITSHIPDGSTLSIPNSLNNNYSLHAYYWFYHRIALDPDLPHPDLLTRSDLPLPSQYRPLPLPTTEYLLCQTSH
ncbi:MAG: glycosyltransferase family 39 protein [Bacteroidales bacterium]|nr:glycosyltransferase family 39 protein [Bacteroidales bacterium]